MQRTSAAETAGREALLQQPQHQKGGLQDGEQRGE
jgi:hypothetical protein